jgi:hypothetical protein
MNLVSVCDFFFHLIQFSSSGTDGLMAQDLVNLENNPNSTKLFFVILVSCCNPVCVAECKFHMYIPNQFSSINAKFWFRLRVFILVTITFFGVTHVTITCSCIFAKTLACRLVAEAIFVAFCFLQTST